MTSSVRSRMGRTVKAFVALALVASAARTVSAQPGWTSVGSAGTVDESDAGVVGFSLSDVTVRGTAPEAVVMRYNVVPVPGVVGGDSLVFTARYRDSGTQTRISLSLRAKNINNGAPHDHRDSGQRRLSAERQPPDSQRARLWPDSGLRKQCLLRRSDWFPKHGRRPSSPFESEDRYRVFLPGLTNGEASRENRPLSRKR